MSHLYQAQHQRQLFLLPGLFQEELGMFGSIPCPLGFPIAPWPACQPFLGHVPCPSSVPRCPSTLSSEPRTDPSPQGEHKALHKSQSNILHHIIPPKVVSEPDPATGVYNPFPAFHYTGPLRPVYPLSPKRVIPKSIPHPEWSEDGIPKYRARPGRTKVDILDAKAQDAMRKVCRLAREVLDIAAAAIRPGITTDYIDEIVHNACIERNVSGSNIYALYFCISGPR